MGSCWWNWIPTILFGVGWSLLFPTNEVFGAEATVESILPAPIPRARWGEVWSVVNDHPERRYESLSHLPFKFVPLNEAGTNYMSFGGEFRLTYEMYDPRDRGLTDVGRSDALMNRLAAHADWHLNPRWRIFGQLGHAAAGDREGGAKPGDESDLNVWQAFVDRRFDLESGERLEFRLGRQFIEKGNWFIGAGEAPNVRQYYDGIRLAWLDNRYAKFDAFATEYVDTATGTFEMGGAGEYFWGASAGFRIDSPEVNVSALYFGWDLEDLQFQHSGGDFHDERRHTLIGWVNKPVSVENHWSYDYYLAYQFGSYDDTADSDIQAFSAFGEVKYALRDEVRTPVIGLRTSYFSGDSDPDDDKLETFYNPVFVTVYFSYARDIQPFNLLHLQPNVGYRFSEKLSVTLSADFLWRDRRTDAFYDKAGIVVAADESDGNYIGSQAQLAINWRPAQAIVATMHVVRYWAGEVIDDAGGEDQTYLRFEFSYLL